MSSAALADFLPDTAYVRAHIAPVVSPMPTRAWTFSTCAGAIPLSGHEMALTTTW